MAKQSHTDALMVAGAGLAAFAGYEFLYRPWKAKKDLAALTGTPPAAGGGLSPFFSTPTIVGPAVSPGGQQGSIVDPRANPGGDVGQAMWRKNWTQQYATDRLAAIKAAYARSISAINALKSQVANPNASAVPAAQLALQQSDAAAANAATQQQAALARGDQVAAATWASALAAHQQDSQEIRGRIAAASAPPDNTAGIAAYEGAIAGLKADYKALTGLDLA